MFLFGTIENQKNYCEISRNSVKILLCVVFKQKSKSLHKLLIYFFNF